jgi:hypothetical protein
VHRLSAIPCRSMQIDFLDTAGSTQRRSGFPTHDPVATVVLIEGGSLSRATLPSTPETYFCVS